MQYANQHIAIDILHTLARRDIEDTAQSECKRRIVGIVIFIGNVDAEFRCQFKILEQRRIITQCDITARNFALAEVFGEVFKRKSTFDEELLIGHKADIKTDPEL